MGGRRLRAGLMRSLLAGMTAALVAPVVLRRSTLERLLEPPSARVPPPAEPDDALRWARAFVFALSRLPWSPWRDTCLYRSVAECLVLRRHGVPAVLRIGVREASSREGIEAHAWVERPGVAARDGTTTFVAVGRRPAKA